MPASWPWSVFPGYALRPGVIAVTAGRKQSLALKSDGTLVGWGVYMDEGGPPEDLPPLVALCSGSYHTLGLTGAGTVYGWGWDAWGQTTVPTGLTGVRAVAGGGYHSLALKADGSIVAWGDDTYGQLELPDALNHSTITVTAEDSAGNTSSMAITVNRSPDAAGNLNDPVQLSATPIAGFDPLTVTLTPTANVPGTIQSVLYDFKGDNSSLESHNDLAAVTHSYSAGQYFPVVTIQTTAGSFSSGGGWNSSDPNRLRINVQAPPEQIGNPISVIDPIDIKCTTDGSLYILSRSAATILRYNTTVDPPELMNSLPGIGTTPTGFDVDSDGNVYVALSGDNQVAKFETTSGSFQLDTTFGSGGIIGKADKNTGTGNGEFNAPYDVAVSPDGAQIAVSESGNNRIQEFDQNGAFVDHFGSLGSGTGQFDRPKGVANSTSGYLYIADSGNNRIVLAAADRSVIETSGTLGSGLGQFQAPANIALGSHGTYVADTGNNRIQSFSPAAPHAPFSSDELSIRSPILASLNEPAAIASANDLVHETVYVADTGNNRVLVYRLGADDPSLAWNTMRNSLEAADVPGALANFSVATKDEYQQAFLSAGTAKISSAISRIGTLSPIFINDDVAHYYFTDTVNGQLITFIVKLTRENGTWKIMEF